MTAYLSKKLTFFSFWLIIVVVLLHALTIRPPIESADVFDYTELLISLHLAQIAVPMFFMISGYLFFFSLGKGVRFIQDEYLKKLKKRTRTLLLPYILWCVFWFSIVYILQVLPYTASFFNQPLHSLSFKENIYNLLVYPLNYPFWFLRELMLYTVITPIIFFMIRKFKVFLLVILVVISLFQESLFVVGGIKMFHIYPLLFYSIGCYLGIHKKNIEMRIGTPLLVVLIACWFVLNNFAVYVEYFWEDWYLPQQLIFVKNLMGCLGMWFLYDHFGNSIKKPLAMYSLSFFIFAFHGIPILFIKKIIEKLPAPNEFVGFLYYLFVFLLGTAVSIIFGFLIKKYFKSVYLVLTGNR